MPVLELAEAECKDTFLLQEHSDPLDAIHRESDSRLLAWAAAPRVHHPRVGFADCTRLDTPARHFFVVCCLGLAKRQSENELGAGPSIAKTLAAPAFESDDRAFHHWLPLTNASQEPLATKTSRRSCPWA